MFGQNSAFSLKNRTRNRYISRQAFDPNVAPPPPAPPPLRQKITNLVSETNKYKKHTPLNHLFSLIFNFLCLPEISIGMNNNNHKIYMFFLRGLQTNSHCLCINDFETDAFYLLTICLRYHIHIILKIQHS